ncbi:MAG: hypothetical protein AAFW84_21270 [Cyanobacteria bacterium J06635_15]
MTENLVFSKFKSQEFDALTELLCEVFVTTKSELELLYQAIIDDFDKEGWPPHFANRSFFKSDDRKFRETYRISPSIAVDLPSLFELDNGIDDKATIVILGQDSKSDQDFEKISLGTPYGLHHRGSREVLTRTKLYFEMVSVLLELGYRVYLTDIHKVWVCNPGRPYHGIKLPKVDREKFISVLKSELLIINPVAVVTWGRVSAKSVTAIDLDIRHLRFPHPSGAANGAWEKLMNQSPTYTNKMAYWKSVISASLSEST